MASWFHWRDEGEQIRPGLNLYPPHSPHHLGGYLQIGRLRFYVRWAKLCGRLHYNIRWLPRDEVSLPLSQAR